MPIYEYQCSQCRYYLEVMQKVSDARLRRCPSCGRNTLQKLISAPVFRLKGSGWYETDFKSDQEQKRNLAAAEKAEQASAEGKPADAKDAKDAKESGEAKAPATAEGTAEAKGAAAGGKGESGGPKAGSAGQGVTAATRKAARRVRPTPKRVASAARAKAVKRRSRR